MEHRKNALAHRLTGLMAAKGWTQSDLARQMFGTYIDPATGYVMPKSRERVSAWVSGKAYPKPRNLARLAEVFGLTVDELTPVLPQDPDTIKGYFIVFL